MAHILTAQWQDAAVPELRGERGGGGARAPDHPQQVQQRGGGVELVGEAADLLQDAQDGRVRQQQPRAVEDRAAGGWGVPGRYRCQGGNKVATE